jgi:hypothetical protein
LGGAAAAGGHDAANALDMDFSCFGMDRAHSRPANIMKAQKCGLLPEGAVLSEELGVAHRVAPFPSGRFVVP